MSSTGKRPRWERPSGSTRSNYLLQSVIGSLLFFGFGLGLYDRLGTAAGALVAVAIFTAQIGVSRLWLKRFQLGPVEWL